MARIEQLMLGKTCLVTGGTAGIGLVSARELARMGSTVVIVSRSASKVAGVVKDLVKTTGNSRIEGIVADLSSQAEVRLAARKFRDRHQQLDVLLNNAGAIFHKRRESVDGYEMTWALNQLGYFLLTHELLEPLQAAPSARVVVVASEAHRGGRLNWEDLQARKRYGFWKAYCDSKLANIHFAFELARRFELAKLPITANALHPGFVKTDFGRNEGGLVVSFRVLANLFAMNQEKGARTSIYLASSPEVTQVTGQYFDKCRSILPTQAARNSDDARRLWSVCEDLTGACHWPSP